MPYCGSCGKPLEEGDKFCRNCGAPTGAKRPEQKPLGVRGSGPRLALRVVSTIGWFIVSLVVTGIIIAVIALTVLMPLFGGADIVGYALILLSIVIFPVILHKLRTRFLEQRPPTLGGVVAGGVSDLRGGFQSTARYVEYKTIRPFWSQEEDTIMRFRGEVTDPQGNITGYVPVEIRTAQHKWVGQIGEGDKIVVRGELGKDGILRAKRAFNVTTNSTVGEG